jgi:hypothetical protein
MYLLICNQDNFSGNFSIFHFHLRKDAQSTECIWMNLNNKCNLHYIFSKKSYFYYKNTGLHIENMNNDLHMKHNVVDIYHRLTSINLCKIQEHNLYMYYYRSINYSISLHMNSSLHRYFFFYRDKSRLGSYCM